MFGQKKKNQATTAKAPKTDAKYADAIGWESSRLSLAKKSEARAWLTAKILGATNIALVAAIVIMMPLKEMLPYVIEVDKSTGMSTILSVANAEEIPVSEVMDKYWRPSARSLRLPHVGKRLHQDARALDAQRL